MGTVIADISISLDGYVAGPHDGRQSGLGEGGEPLHNWVMGGEWSGDADFRATGVDRELLDAAMNVGASVIGRRMYDVTDGWGGDAAFGFPVFVLTSRPHPRRELGGASSYTFVTDGIDSALAQARAAAGDKDVAIGGGARAIQQYLAAGLVDELSVHIAPLLLGAGTPLFADLGDVPRRMTIDRVVESPHTTHIRYRMR